jgi:hypothetical protein
MPKLSDLKRGRTLWVDVGGTPPAVVIAEGATSIVVICGTSKRKSDPDEVCIMPKTPAGVSLGLTDPTYFYSWKVAVIRSENKIKSVKGPCPPGVFLQLDRLAASAARKTKDREIREALRVIAPIAVGVVPTASPAAAAPPSPTRPLTPVPGADPPKGRDEPTD